MYFRILEKAVKINGKTWTENKQLRSINKMTVDASEENEEKTNETLRSSQKQVNLFDLFRTPNLRKNTLIQYFNWFTVVLVYYGITLNADTLIPGNTCHSQYM